MTCLHGKTLDVRIILAATASESAQQILHDTFTMGLIVKITSGQILLQGTLKFAYSFKQTSDS